MDKKKFENYIKRHLDIAKKISNDNNEEYEEYLISRNICPTCKSLTIVHSDGNYCSQCGRIFDDSVMYESHGTEFDDGRNRKEIYVPPSTLRNAAKPFYSMNLVGSRIRGARRVKFEHLKKINFYITASYSKNSQVVKKMEYLMAILNIYQASETRKLITETALMLYSKLQKRFRTWKKINIYSVMVLAANQMGVKIDIKKLYDLENNKKISLNKFRRNINRGTERIFSVLEKKEKENLRNFMLTEILKSSGVKNITPEYLGAINKTIDVILKVYPNITFYDSVKTIVSRLYRNKNYKMLPGNANSIINEIIDKKLGKYHFK